MNMFIPKGKKSPIKSKKNDAELRRHSFVCDTVRLSLRALGSRASTLIQFLARSRPVVDGELAVCRRGSVSWQMQTETVCYQTLPLTVRH